ncbi:hypothetical protein KKH18_14080 [bacterium]|nr:hypothetical protein [bacterium]
MMTQRLLSIPMLLILFCVAGADPSSSWERESSYNQLFNAQNIETVKGTITEISTYTIPDGAGSGVQLTIENSGKQIAVHLGPEWYIQHQAKQFEVGEKITVKGSRVDFEGSSVLLALAVVMDSHMLVLRSASGAPVWSGWQSMR